KVYVVHRRNEFRAERIMIDKLLERAGGGGNVEVLWDHVLDEVLGNEQGVTGARLLNVKTKTPHELDIQGLFIAIGHTPNRQIFEGQLDMSGGHIVVQSGQRSFATATSVPGVFAAGDVADPLYRQAVTSAGSGCMAALDAERFLT